MLATPWTGALLDSVEAVGQVAATMPWQGRTPSRRLVTTTYRPGGRLTTAALQPVATQRRRRPGLAQWCVDIVPEPLAGRQSSFVGSP